MLAISAITAFSVINVLGVAPGAVVQNIFTLLKLAAIAGLIVSGLFFSASLTAGADAAAIAATAAVNAAPALLAPVGWSAIAVAIGTALVPVLFAYGGWQQTNFVAEEMVDPRRDLPRALIIGVLIVAAAYLLVNLTYLRTLGVEALAASKAPAADAMAMRFGETGRRLIAIGIAISTAGFLNVVILVTPRVYQAMAKDGVFFSALATLHPRTRTPVAAIVLQGAWSIALVLSGSYGDLLDWVTFADWIFFGATAATLLVYRRREASGAYFMAPFHPWSTAVFLLAAGYVVLGAIVSNPMNALRGTLVLAAGIPVYLWWRRGAAAAR
jgi:APA family basic amino acid/polyamine antiporter